MNWQNLKQRWALMAGTALLCGTVLSSGALAASPSATRDSQPATNLLERAVQEGTLSQGEADVIKEIGQLRKAAMEKLVADAKGVIEGAVKSGKITREQADRMLQQMGRMGHGPKGHRHINMSPEQLKAKLAEKVKAGEITQEQADQILKRFTERKSR